MNKGIDVSQHQGSVDWPKVKQAGYRYAICKCSEGQDFVDPRWNDARAHAIRGAGLELGVYHYLRPKPGRTGDVEARHAVKTAKAAGWGRPGDVRLAVDIEETALGMAATRRYLAEFVEEYVDLMGHTPLVYSFPSFLARLGLRKTSGCPLWIAHFDVVKPVVPKPWERYTIWQHTATGTVPGVQGHVDLDKNDTLPAIPKEKPKPLTKRQRTARRMRRARRTYMRTHADRALRVYLVSKARLGRWDPRYCMYYGVPDDVQPKVKKFITRGYAAGLVPTSTTGGRHAPGSYHGMHRAADMGVRRDVLGTPTQTRRLRKFQQAEWNRRNRTEPIELIGPVNNLIVLRSSDTALAEGSALENQHDDHVHGAF